ncbi:hypothetical protein V8F20_004127 [Naviculisporaceae sp. PSN 640]
MRRTRPIQVPRPASFFSSLVVSLSFSLQCLGLAHPPVPGPNLLAREEYEFPNEHVVLADCTQGEERHLSSQMAYYQNAPNDKPMDIAIVDAQPNQFALWINSNTTAIFTDTGVYFAATLGPKVPEGEWAGYGHNGMPAQGGKPEIIFHTFNCWRSYQFNLYEWQNARCSQVYYCNHDPKPPNAPDIVVTTSLLPHTTQTVAPGASGAVSGGDSNGSGVTADQSSSPGLSHGALIGIIVGSVGVLVVGGLLGLWLLFRRRSRHKNNNKQDTDTSGDLHEADDGTGLGGSRDRKSPDHAGGRQELDAKLQRFEMDTEAHRFEMANNMIAELDGTPVGWDTKDPSDVKLYDLKKEIDSKGGDLKFHRDTGQVRPDETGGLGDRDAVFDEPKTMMGDELKARAIDKQVIRASTGAGSAAVASWTYKDKKEEQRRTEEHQTGDDVPLRAPTTRSQTTWTTWTTDSDVDLAGFPLSSANPVPISPISPLSPSGVRPPNG